MKRFYLFIFLLPAHCLLFAQDFQSSNLPIIIIDTHGVEISDEPKIEADMAIIDNGPGLRNDLSDPRKFEGKIGIEIRGSSSQMFPKKQYGIEIRDSEGEGMSVSLLGMPEEEDWVLFAPYNDKSLMRDVLAYKIGRDMDRYAPRTRYCEVILDGNYEGIYVLIEKIKRDKNRVDISKLDPDEISGDDLTGGYIIKIDKTSGDSGPGWTSSFTPPNRSGSQTITFQYEYPKYDEIAPEQRQYIQQYVNKFEQALAGDDFKDPAVGYAQYADVNSFVDYFIVNEISKNADAYRLSTFIHKQKDSDGGKLLMGPVWDFNLGFGNVDYCTKGNPEGFVIFFNAVCPEDFWLVPFWWERLFEDENFRKKVAERWTALRQGRFKTETIHDYIDSVANVLNQEAQQRNFQRWPVLGQYVWPNYYVGGTFQSEVEWLKDWVSQRLAWLDAHIPGLITATEDFPSSFHLVISAFPNPFDDQLQFEGMIKEKGQVSFALYDFSGKKVDEVTSGRAENGVFREFLGRKVSPGIYFYSVTLNGQTVYGGKAMKR